MREEDGKKGDEEHFENRKLYRRKTSKINKTLTV